MTTSDVELMANGAVTITAAVREFSVSRSKIYELMQAGTLPYSDANGRRLIPRLALQRWLAAGLRGHSVEMS